MKKSAPYRPVKVIWGCLFGKISFVWAQQASEKFASSYVGPQVHYTCTYISIIMMSPSIMWHLARQSAFIPRKALSSTRRICRMTGGVPLNIDHETQLHMGTKFKKGLSRDILYVTCVGGWYFFLREKRSVLHDLKNRTKSG